CHHPRPDQPARGDAGARQPALRAQCHRVAPRVRQGRRAGARPRRRDHQVRLRHARRRSRQPGGPGRPEGGKACMTTDLEVGLYIFMLAGFLGYHLITRVPPLLHTPLMSATNALSGISLVGSMVVPSSVESNFFSTLLGFIAVACSSTNVVGGFLITDRMLKMFKTERKPGDKPWRLQPAWLGAMGGIVIAVGLGLVLAATGQLRDVDPEDVLKWLYIGSGVLFILGLKGLSSPRTARQ